MKRSSPLTVLAVTLLALILSLSQGIAQQFSFGGGGARPLDPEEAFRIELVSIDQGRPVIGWRIADGYYLYRDQIAAHNADG